MVTKQRMALHFLEHLFNGLKKLCQQLEFQMMLSTFYNNIIFLNIV